MTITDLPSLLRWHRGRSKLDTPDREDHLAAVRLLVGVIKRRTAHREAIVAGLAKARAEGRPTGGASRIDPKIEARIIALLRQGVGTRAVMTEVGCGAALIVRIKKDMGLPLGKPGRPAGE